MSSCLCLGHLVIAWIWTDTWNLFRSSSNFISRRIQYDTFHTHHISTISQMSSSGGCQRSSVAHQADNRYFNNATAVGKQGARGNILFYFQMCRTHYIQCMSGSIWSSLIFTYSLLIRHGAHTYKIITIVKHPYRTLWNLINLFIYFSKFFVIVVLKFCLYRCWLTRLKALFHNLAPLILQQLWPIPVLAIGTWRRSFCLRSVPASRTW